MARRNNRSTSTAPTRRSSRLARAVPPQSPTVVAAGSPGTPSSVGDKLHTIESILSNPISAAADALPTSVTGPADSAAGRYTTQIAREAYMASLEQDAPENAAICVALADQLEGAPNSTMPTSDAPSQPKRARTGKLTSY